MPKDYESIADLANSMGLPPYYLRRLQDATDKSYKVFRLSKRSGKGHRTIAAPSVALRGIQRWILTSILRHEKISEYSTAFAPGCSIVKNASVHVGKQFVFNCDISNFFDSISTRRVFRLFRRLGYSKKVSDTLARLTTYRGRLPQGAPTSPAIANLCAYRLDKRLSGFAAKRDWTYTRYADDITLSGHGNFTNRELDTVHRILKEEGFKPNHAKERFSRRTSAQLVTGLVVNKKVSVPRKVRKRLRALFYQANLAPEKFVDRLPELMGKLSFLRQVDSSRPELQKFHTVINSIKTSAASKQG